MRKVYKLLENDGIPVFLVLNKCDAEEDFVKGVEHFIREHCQWASGIVQVASDPRVGPPRLRCHLLPFGRNSDQRAQEVLHVQLQRRCGTPIQGSLWRGWAAKIHEMGLAAALGHPFKLYLLHMALSCVQK